MNNTEIDLLQFKENKNTFVKCMRALCYSIFIWFVITIGIWINYNGNWLNFYQATSYMVTFIVMLFFTIYITHYLNLRFVTYIILCVFSVLMYLDGVNDKIPIIDTLAKFLINLSISPQQAMKDYEDAKFFIGNSYYEALLTWVIIDVPFQMWETKRLKDWETSVKNVYHAISNQILFLLLNPDINKIYVQSNQIHCDKIESFCEKKIKSYSRKLLFSTKKSSSYETYLQIKEQYKSLLSLLQNIRTNSNHLDGNEYLKLLYEADAIFKRSKIICGD